ncbi:MAG TPA: beta-xylosidase [Candidatus Binatia bacterium]|jgi:xylan 1,4-beta-xylosidase|nr:beta-xylosidase [Candidatus Binatia bacterium]
MQVINCLDVLKVRGIVRLAVLLFLALASTLFSAPASAAAPGEAFPVKLSIDASKPEEALNPFWRFFGADEPNYATRKNGKKLLVELGALAPQSVYFRAHNLLTSGDGAPALKWGSTGAYDEDAQGRPIYNWTILDGIFDAYRENGIRPYVEIGFMPKALSVNPEPYQHHWNPEQRYGTIFTGWAFPPKDYQKWSNLVFEWARHCVQKYGRAEVEKWFWEVWNESNIGYWRGTPQEFLKLHDYAIDGVRRALPTARVGGPDAAGSGGRFTRAFLEHCLRGTNFATGKVGTPLDFISFHAKGAPIYTNDHVRMGIAAQLRTMNEGFQIIGSYPELKDKPIVIGESDPEGCAACQGASLAYRNGTMYSSYTAACFARTEELARKHGVRLEGALTWAFEFEDQPYFAGFRTLASNGLDKPVLNAFRMFSQMSGRRLAVESGHAVPLEAMLKAGVRGEPDVSAIASLAQSNLCVLMWHYHDDDLPGPDAAVEVAVEGLPRGKGEARLEHFRIDEDHGNAFAAWKRLGAPPRPSVEQYAQLEKAGHLTLLNTPETVRIENGKLTLGFLLPRQGVSLLKVTW